MGGNVRRAKFLQDPLFAYPQIGGFRMGEEMVFKILFHSQNYP